MAREASFLEEPREFGVIDFIAVQCSHQDEKVVMSVDERVSGENTWNARF